MADAEQPAERAGLSGAGRWAMALAAVVVLVVAFVVLRGGSGDEPAGQPAPPANGTPSSGKTQTETQEEQQQEPQPAAPDVATIRVRGGRPVGGTKTLEFRKGERIRFRVVADEADDVHFHGYDIEKPVGPGTPARFDVKATIEGRFEVELHHAGAQVARVEVVP